ncbi:hypothetical protein VTK26DRAFT_5227 [Humicola hyalothermophila]
MCVWMNTKEEKEKRSIQVLAFHHEYSPIGEMVRYERSRGYASSCTRQVGDLHRVSVCDEQGLVCRRRRICLYLYLRLWCRAVSSILADVAVSISLDTAPRTPILFRSKLIPTETGLCFLLGICFCATQTRYESYHEHIIPPWPLVDTSAWATALEYFNSHVASIGDISLSAWEKAVQPLLPTWTTKVGRTMSGLSVYG